MKGRRISSLIVLVLMLASMLLSGGGLTSAQDIGPDPGTDRDRVTQAERKAAADRAAAAGFELEVAGVADMAMPDAAPR